MITEAFISGRHARAVYEDGGSWIVADTGLAERPAHAFEVLSLRSGFGEFRNVEVSSAEALSSELASDIRFHNLLFLLLSILDPDRSLNTKLICAKAVEPLLEEPDVFNLAKRRLFSSPLALEARLIRGKLLSYIKSFDKLTYLLRSTYDAQPLIDEVLAIWNTRASTIREDRSGRIRANLVDDGTFADLVVAAQSPDLHSFNEATLSVMQRKRGQEVDFVVRPFISETRAFLQRKLFDKPASQLSLPIKKVASRSSASSRAAASIDELLASEDRLQRSSLRSFEIKTIVDKQISGIRDQLLRGNDVKVEKYIEELVKFQLGHSERGQLAKSLCSLSSLSLSANQLDIADKLSRYALSLTIEDPVIFTNRAEVLKSMGFFQASLQAYKEASIRFPGSSYAWNGIADVLKESGQFSESLIAYREAQKRFPDSAVARNGYVATLRAQGRNREALQEAIEVLKDFTDDAVSLITYASALGANGKYDFALKQYEKVLELGNSDIRAFGGYIRSLNLVGQSERALAKAISYKTEAHDTYGASTLLVSQLRIVGKFEEAISLAERVLEEAPGYIPMKYQLATALVSLRRFDDAAVYLHQGELRSQMDWAGFKVYVTAMLAEGRFAQAKTLLLERINRCDWRYIKNQLLTLLGFAQYKLKRASLAIAVLETDIDSLDDHARQTRLVLLGAAQKARGKEHAATSLLTSQVNTREPRLLAFRDAVMRSQRHNFHISAETELDYLLAA